MARLTAPRLESFEERRVDAAGAGGPRFEVLDAASLAVAGGLGRFAPVWAVREGDFVSPSP